jgi:hypothetical protein
MTIFICVILLSPLGPLRRWGGHDRTVPRVGTRPPAAITGRQAIKCHAKSGNRR